MLGFRFRTGFYGFGCLLLLAANLSAWSTPAFGDPEFVALVGNSEPVDSFLINAREMNYHLHDSMESFVCQERIDRFRDKRDHRIDTITAKLSVESGVEKYIDLKRNNRKLRDLAAISGAWSKGEFLTLLKLTEKELLGAPQVSFEGKERLGERYAAIYEFAVPLSESSWDLLVSGKWYEVAFRTRVWILESSSQIVKVQRISTEIPAALGISEIRWEVMLNEIDVDGRLRLLPETAEYDVLYSDSHRFWNSMKFFEYHHYGADVSIHFN
jgi:hypothetical protein